MTAFELIRQALATLGDDTELIFTTDHDDESGDSVMVEVWGLQADDSDSPTLLFATSVTDEQQLLEALLAAGEVRS